MYKRRLHIDSIFFERRSININSYLWSWSIHIFIYIWIYISIWKTYWYIAHQNIDSLRSCTATPRNPFFPKCRATLTNGPLNVLRRWAQLMIHSQRTGFRFQNSYNSFWKKGAENLPKNIVFLWEKKVHCWNRWMLLYYA